jgi:poly(3-hydroxybutyrate) depolymerase
MTRKFFISRFVPTTALVCLTFVALLHARARQKLAKKPPQANGYGDDQLVPGDYKWTVRVGELERRYSLHIPKQYQASKAKPVVVVFHGGGGNPDSMIRMTGINAKADEAGFIVVNSFGTGKLTNTLLTFNGGEC